MAPRALKLVAPHVVPEAAGAEAAPDGHWITAEQPLHRGQEERVGVKERQAGVENIAGAVADLREERQPGEAEAAVAHDNRLRQTRGAGGVEKDGGGPRRHRRAGWPGVGVGEPLDRNGVAGQRRAGLRLGRVHDHMADAGKVGLQRRERVEQLGSDDQRLGLGVAENVCQPFAAQRDVDRHRIGTELLRGEEGRQPCGRVAHHDGHASARANAERGEAIGDAVGAPVERGVADALVIKQQKDLFAFLAGSRLE